MEEVKDKRPEIKRDTDLFETIFITLMVGIVGSVFIMGTFIYQEIQMEREINKIIISKTKK